MKSIDVSIIIVSYNTAKELKNCISSIVNETQSITCQIIVVDNNSSDNSCEMIRCEFPRVELIENKFNAGFAKANNQGLQIATGEFILYLNPDTIILDKAIEKMITFLKNHQEIGLVGPHTFNADGKTTQSTAHYHPSLIGFFHHNVPIWRIIPFYHPPLFGEYSPKNSVQVDAVKGSCMLLARTLAEEIGGMNEEYFMYSEEIDLCEAMRNRGLEVYYFTDASIVHLGGASTSQVSEAMVIARMKSLKINFHKQYPNSNLLAIRLLMIFGSFWRLMAWKIVETANIKDKTLALSRQSDHKTIMQWAFRDFS